MPQDGVVHFTSVSQPRAAGMMGSPARASGIAMLVKGPRLSRQGVRTRVAVGRRRDVCCLLSFVLEIVL